MSSLRDDLNSRAYTSADRYHRSRDLDDGTIDPTGRCVVCGEDCVRVNDAGECAECEPKDGETCSDWLDRTRARRAGK